MREGGGGGEGSNLKIHVLIFFLHTAYNQLMCHYYLYCVLQGKQVVLLSIGIELR